MAGNSSEKGFWSVIGLIIAGFFGFLIYSSMQPGKYDTFAQCLTDSGAKFYGAFWCPHCQSQKALFGKSDDLIPYIECSTADGRGQNQVCKDAGITGYPTWIFADGTVKGGSLSLNELADQTGCVLPGESESVESANSTSSGSGSYMELPSN